MTRQSVDEGLRTVSVQWDQGNREPAVRQDVYLTVSTALFDIDDENARRWGSKTEWDAARADATRNIVQALTRKYVVARDRPLSAGGALANSYLLMALVVLLTLPPF